MTLLICVRYINRKSETSDSVRVLLVGAGRDDVGELGDRMPDLVLGVEEVRADPDPAFGIRSEVADDAALAELGMDGGVVRRRDGDRPAAALGYARGDDRETGGVALI